MKRTAIFIGALAFAFTSIAEDMTFPLNGGYLDSATDWGGAIPSLSDTVTLDKPGVYRISEDVVFKSLCIASGGITNDFGEHKISFVNKVGVRCTNGIYKVFSGGKYSTGDFYCNFSSGSKNGEVLFTNECEVVCTNMFYSARYVDGTITRITDGSKVYAKDLRIQNDPGRNNELVVSGGGEVHVPNEMYWEANVGNAEGTDGSNRMKVEGLGSLYRLTSGYMVKVGQRLSNDLFLLTDGARADSVKGGVDLGGVSTTNAQLIVENRSLAEFKKVKILSKNLFAVDTCATAVVSEVEFAKADSMMKVSGNACAYLGGFSISGSGNTIMVSDSTLVASNKSIRTTLGSLSSSSNNVLRICGASSMVKLDASAKDIFGNGHHNTLSIEGGAEMTSYFYRTMTNTHHSTISVTGLGSRLNLSGNGLCLGDKDNVNGNNFTVSNTVYVGDGAVLDAGRIMITGTDNRLVVSNATLNLVQADDGLGLSIGRRDTPMDIGNALVLQGSRPKVTSAIESTTKDRFTFRGGSKSILRFEIPEEGWERGHVAIDIKGKFTFGSDATLEIDCEDFVAKTGGKLHLIKAGYISEDSANTLKKAVLPEGATLEVSNGNVYLKSPFKVGFVFSVR